MEHFVIVWQGQAEARGLAIHLGDEDQFRIRQGKQFIHDGVKLRIGHRHRAPVVFPGLGIDLKDRLDILAQLLFVFAEGADVHIGAPRDQFGSLLHPGGYLFIFRQIGIEIHHFHQAVVFIEPLVIGLVVPHHHHGR